MEVEEEINIVCPLGSNCKEIKDNKIYHCAWYTRIAGTDPEGNQVDKWGCAMSWLPTLLVENAMTNRGQTEALESFRNESARGQETFNRILLEASKIKKLGE